MWCSYMWGNYIRVHRGKQADRQDSHNDQMVTVIIPVMILLPVRLPLPVNYYGGAVLFQCIKTSENSCIFVPPAFMLRGI